jgi:hypothetical protein
MTMTRRLQTRSGLKQLSVRGTGVADQLTAAFRDGASDEELIDTFWAWAGDIEKPNAPMLRNCIASLLVMGGADLAAVNRWLRP